MPHNLLNVGYVCGRVVRFRHCFCVHLTSQKHICAEFYFSLLERSGGCRFSMFIARFSLLVGGSEIITPYDRYKSTTER